MARRRVDVEQDETFGEAVDERVATRSPRSPAARAVAWVVALILIVAAVALAWWAFAETDEGDEIGEDPVEQELEPFEEG